MLSPPAPLIPRVPAGRELRLTDIAPIELARQLTIFEFTNFQRIKPVECLHKAWNEDDEEKAPNVRKVIHTANKLAGWVSLLVLQPRDAKQRATVMKYFIQTAAVSALPGIAGVSLADRLQELKNMNNFSSMAGIVAGLNAAPVDRLKRTKELLSSKTLVLKEELDRTMDSSKNFLNYKEALKTINPPCVPFFGE
jgi:son of sevenless-like protein